MPLSLGGRTARSARVPPPVRLKFQVRREQRLGSASTPAGIPST
ncbi:MAG TPA: hypothetical protein VHV55_18065 [Pirellulales bacterium]|nr:hypothetical protein [Pirellulales bacterium]